MVSWLVLPGIPQVKNLKNGNIPSKTALRRQPTDKPQPSLNIGKHLTDHTQYSLCLVPGLILSSHKKALASRLIEARNYIQSFIMPIFRNHLGFSFVTVCFEYSVFRLYSFILIYSKYSKLYFVTLWLFGVRLSKTVIISRAALTDGMDSRFHFHSQWAALTVEMNNTFY